MDLPVCKGTQLPPLTPEEEGWGCRTGWAEKREQLEYSPPEVASWPPEYNGSTPVCGGKREKDISHRGGEEKMET